MLAGSPIPQRRSEEGPLSTAKSAGAAWERIAALIETGRRPKIDVLVAAVGDDERIPGAVRKYVRWLLDPD